MRKEITSNLDNPKYWDDAYQNESDRWTLNSPNPVFVQVLADKKFYKPGNKILIAGAGKGYDAAAAVKFDLNVTAVDFSDEANKHAEQVAAAAGVKIKFVNEDLFKIGERFNSHFDLVYEYVTICAVNPNRRDELLLNFYNSLSENGRLITVLFPIDAREGGPPFSIELNEFYKLASKYFSLEYFQRNINSIKPRKGNEVLLILKKKEI